MTAGPLIRGIIIVLSMSVHKKGKFRLEYSLYKPFKTLLCNLILYLFFDSIRGGRDI